MDKCVIVYSTIHLARVYLHRRRKFLSMRKFQDASFLSLLVYIYTPLFRSAFLSFKARCILSSKKKKKKPAASLLMATTNKVLDSSSLKLRGPFPEKKKKKIIMRSSFVTPVRGAIGRRVFRSVFLVLKKASSVSSLPCLQCEN